MADEIRRSGRANKGHHTKNADALDEPAPKTTTAATTTKSKAKADRPDSKKALSQPSRSQSAQTPEQEDDDEEEEAIIRCVCGDQRDIRGRQMICCDKCEAWQHNQCLDLPEGDFWDNKSYYCEKCHPQDHVELLAAMARGEKPWNRKNRKSKKAKSRPSDIKAEPVKKDRPTPSPSQKSTPAPVLPPAQSEAPAETPAPDPAPAPASVTVPAPEPEPKEPSNGQSKPKNETPKSQPQSPLGEKRRHESVAEKESANKKRRKSGAPAEKAEPHSTATGIDALPAKQRPAAEKLRDILIPLVEAASSRGYKVPDGDSATSIATSLALDIYHALLAHGDPEKHDSPFSAQIRTIMFNVKKNTILVDRLLSGNLSSEEFAGMSAEEMASEEKQKEYAALREANEKQMVLTEDTGPRLRKTHKGEEFVGGDQATSHHDEFVAPPMRDREEAPEARPAQPQSPPRDGQSAVELPEDLGQRVPLAVDTAGVPVDGMRRPSTNFDINSVFDKVRSPQADQQAFLQRRQSSIRTQETPRNGPGDDADIDRLLKDEDNDVEMSGIRPDPNIVWKGTVQMQQMEPFEASARFVAGGDFGQVIPWDKLLSSVLPIQGRIESHKGDDYIRGLAQSGSHDVCVLTLTPSTSEGHGVMDHIYNYFKPRDRWGVIPVEGNEALRDLYIVPVESGESNLPPFLDMLEYCTLETPRKEPMMLLALIAKLPETKQALQPGPFDQYQVQQTPSAQTQHPVQPPNGPAPGPSPSPLTNPHGPQYSPMNTAFPPQTPDFNNHQHANFPPYQPAQGHSHNGYYPYPPPQGAPMPPSQASSLIPTPAPLAVEVLGPHLHASTIARILASCDGGIRMTREQLGSLRSIMDNVPSARHDFAAFQKHLEDAAKADNLRS